jgi:hypothetical protein
MPVARRERGVEDPAQIRACSSLVGVVSLVAGLRGHERQADHPRLRRPNASQCRWGHPMISPLDKPTSQQVIAVC